jgi:predicted nucleic acid-binding protein
MLHFRMRWMTPETPFIPRLCVILVDTNVAARAIQTSHRHHQAAVEASFQLASVDGEEFCICVHSLYELAFIMTKPLPSNGFGYTAQRACSELTNVQAMFAMLPESINTFQTRKALLTKYGITNRPCFDAKIVASMIENAVPRILTFNVRDFDQFTEIKVLNPFDVLGIPHIP